MVKGSTTASATRYAGRIRAIRAIQKAPGANSRLLNRGCSLRASLYFNATTLPGAPSTPDGTFHPDGAQFAAMVCRQKPTERGKRQRYNNTKTVFVTSPACSVCPVRQKACSFLGAHLRCRF